MACNQRNKPMMYFSQNAQQNATKKEQTNTAYTCAPILYINLDEAYATKHDYDGILFYHKSRKEDEEYLEKDKKDQDEKVLKRIEMYRKRRIELVANLARLLILNKLVGFSYKVVTESFQELKDKIRIYDQFIWCDRSLGGTSSAKGITITSDYKLSKVAFKEESTINWSAKDDKTGEHVPHYLSIASTMFHEMLHGYYERAIKYCKLDTSEFPPGYYTNDGHQSGHVEPINPDTGYIISNVLNSANNRWTVPRYVSKDRLDQPLSQDGYNLLLDHTYNIIDNFLKGCKKDD